MKTIDKQQGFSETEALSKITSGLPHPLNTAAFFMPKPQARAFHGGLIVGEYNTEREYPAAASSNAESETRRLSSNGGNLEITRIAHAKHHSRLFCHHLITRYASA